MTEKFKDRPLLVASPPVIFFACLIAGGLLHALFRSTLGSFPDALRPGCGIILLSLAGIIAASAFWVLHQHRTPFNPYKPTARIARNGIYRFSRNPMYLSLVLVLAALALLVNASSFILTTILFVAIISRGVIQPEEQYLEEKFGDVYREYKARVRRWL